MNKFEKMNDVIFKVSFGNFSNPINVVENIDIKANCDFKIVESEKNVTFVSNNEELARLEKLSSENGETWATFHSSNAHFFGFGEKMGFLDKRGRNMKMMNMDNPLHTPDLDPMYISIPFFIVLSPKKPAMGFYVNSTSRSFFNMKNDSYTFGVEDAGIEFYAIYGPTVADVIEHFTAIVGRIPMPPAWALGYQQSRWSYTTAQEALDVSRKMRKDGIPCDVIYLDIDYMKGYRVFTWGDGFNDPKTFVDEMRKNGFKVVVIMDPGVKEEDGYKVYESGKAINAFTKSENGDNFTGYVWPGKCVFPDFLRSDVRQWWALQHKDLFEADVAGIWNDMNEPSIVWTDTNTKELKDLLSIDEPMSFALLEKLKEFTFQKDYAHKITHMDDLNKKWPHLKVRNVYALLEAMATTKAFEIYRPNERPFILSRSGFASIQKYAAVWTGDNSSWWEHLKAEMPISMGLGLSGVSFCGADVGGFGGNTTAELLVRWTEIGAFLPFFRNHSAIGTKHQEPWAFGEDVERILKKYIKMRYELFPYLYTLFFQSHKSGIPMMRPLLMYDQNDENLYNINDEFMVGNSMIVAPITEPNTTWRSVYFPQGKWIDVRNEKKYNGKRVYKIDAPLDEIPVFVKEDSIVPRTDSMNYLFEREKMTLYLDFYGQQASTQIYEDDGETLDYKKGIYNIYQVSVGSESTGYNVSIKALHKKYNGRYKKVVMNFITSKEIRSSAIQINGKMVKSYFENGILKADFDLEAL